MHIFVMYGHWTLCSVNTCERALCCISCSVMSDCLLPMDRSPQGSSVHGILQARILEYIAMLSSRGSSQPRDRTQVSHSEGEFFTTWATRERGRASKACRFLGITPTKFESTVLESDPWTCRCLKNHLWKTLLQSLSWTLRMSSSQLSKIRCA